MKLQPEPVSDVMQEISELIPGDYFVTEDLKVDDELRPPLAQRDTRRLVIYLKRCTIGPFINRQDNEGDTIRARINGVDHIRVPARKWKSIEKLRGLQICREYGTVSPNYLYNEVNDSCLLDNPVSVIFGDSAQAAAESAGIPSLAIYEQGLSVQAVHEATERIQHNALSEAGTMMNLRGEKKGRFRESLYDILYVREGTVFLQSITLEAPTREALGFLLMTLDATRYGAGKQVLGNNIRNEVLGLLATRNEPPVTPYTVLAKLGKERSPEKACELYIAQAREWGGHFVGGARIEALRSSIRNDMEGRKRLMNDLAKAAKAYYEFVYGPKERGGAPRRRGKRQGGTEKAMNEEES